MGRPCAKPRGQLKSRLRVRLLSPPPRSFTYLELECEPNEEGVAVVPVTTTKVSTDDLREAARRLRATAIQGRPAHDENDMTYESEYHYSTSPRRKRYARRLVIGVLFGLVVAWLVGGKR